MNHEERIRELEEKEQALMVQSFEGAKAGGVSPSIVQELAAVRAKLKAARRIRAMEAKRTEPKKTSRFSILLPDDELEILMKRAEEKGVIFSSYIRHLLRIGLEVEDKGRTGGKSGG